MKKTLLIIFIGSVIGNSLIAQSVKIGYSPQQIRGEFGKNIFPENGFMYDKNTNDPFFSMMEDGCVINYTFKDNICVSCLVIPGSEDMVNQLIANYNNKYVKKESSNKDYLFWTAYMSGGNVNINFVRNENGTMYFYYY